MAAAFIVDRRDLVGIQVVGDVGVVGGRDIELPAADPGGGDVYGGVNGVRDCAGVSKNKSDVTADSIHQDTIHFSRMVVIECDDPVIDAGRWIAADPRGRGDYFWTNVCQAGVGIVGRGNRSLFLSRQNIGQCRIDLLINRFLRLPNDDVRNNSLIRLIMMIRTPDKR
jgi:hypothetical protein